MKPIVKRKGIEQKFDERKVYASCYNACLNVPIKQRETEEICEKVCKDIKGWIKGKKMVTSKQVFAATTRFLKNYSKEAAFMYKTHRDVN